MSELALSELATATLRRTREYVIFGPEWWLYVLNRIAEQPADRVLTALADISLA